MDERDEIKEAITVFDKDNKGFLTRDQVEHMIKNVGEEMSETDTLQILESVDYDEEGHISIEKFTDIVLNI